MTLTFFKNMPILLLVLLLPLHVLISIAALGRYTIRGRAHVILRAKRDAILALPSLWHKRKAVQQAKQIGALAVWRCLDKSPLTKAQFDS